MDIAEWFTQLPPVTKVYLSSAVGLTLLVTMEVIQFSDLLYTPQLAFSFGEYWRIVTNFLFFGDLGINFIFHMFFLIRYSRGLEEGHYRNRRADFLWILLVSSGLILLVYPLTAMPLNSFSLTFVLVYLWSRQNPWVAMQFFGVLTFRAPYLPWVFLAFGVLMGGSAVLDLVGIVIGHVIYYLDVVVPSLGGPNFSKCPPPLRPILGFGQ